jgi:hypothetical protein
MYQKFLIRETDRFNPDNFPQLESCLETIVLQLNREPAGPKAEMLLSFAKNHSLDSQHVADHLKLASLISTKTLPLGVIEDLFESSKGNAPFTRDLEAHVRSYLAAAPLY